MICNFLILFLCGILSCFIVDTAADEAIINGIRAGIDQFPYQISLQYEQNQHFCGGGIINELFILTAAHCIINDDNTFETRPIFVLAGTNDFSKRNKPAMFVEIHKVFVPTAYKPIIFPKAADIAVIKLKHPLKLSRNIKKMQLPYHKYETYYGRTAVVAGFGWQWVRMRDGKRSGGRNDTQLRFAIVDIREDVQIGLSHIQVPDFIVYAKFKQYDSKPSGVCLGDSGSPLIHDETVIGVLSQTPSTCSEISIGGMYSSVAYYLNFVKNALQDKHHHDIRTHVVGHNG